MVNGSTFIWSCSINHETFFDGVGLDNACVEPGLKQSLKNNIKDKTLAKLVER